MGKGKTGRKGDEGKSNGGGGGGGCEEERGKKCLHYSIDMKSTLPIEVISSVNGGGGVNFWSFVDTFCNFVRTN